MNYSVVPVEGQNQRIEGFETAEEHECVITRTGTHIIEPGSGRIKLFGQKGKFASTSSTVLKNVAIIFLLKYGVVASTE